MFIAILRLYQQEQTKFSDLYTQKWSWLGLVSHAIKTKNPLHSHWGKFIFRATQLLFQDCLQSLPRLKFGGLWIFQPPKTSSNHIRTYTIFLLSLWCLPFYIFQVPSLSFLFGAYFLSYKKKILFHLSMTIPHPRTLFHSFPYSSWINIKYLIPSKNLIIIFMEKFNV